MDSYRDISWPEGKSFAFTIFDDPDAQTLEAGRAVYAFLSDLGYRTTKGVWPIWGNEPRSDRGGTCDDSDYRDWCLAMKASGFEIGYHNATQYTSHRVQTLRGLDRFAQHFGHYPQSMSNHYNCNESIYWGPDRLTGLHKLFYILLTRGKTRNQSFGHITGHPLFWGDACATRIKYVRNFVYSDINTLKACPIMPYHDPRRPHVNLWYASSDGANVQRFNQLLTEKNQDLLESEGGACIVYTHFGHGYMEGGTLNQRFRELMLRLSRKNGWFVPVTTLLDYLRMQNGNRVLTDDQRDVLERRWLWAKIRHGAS